MISTVNGVVRAVHSDRLIVEVGGVGLSILVNSRTSAEVSIGSQILLYTVLVVREDSLSLYGFIHDEARTIFELVQTVSGIGPKVALSILGALTPEDLGRAVASDDVSAIERVPGIGKKGAQRLILELKGKLSPLTSSAGFSAHLPAWREDLAGALITLGFSPRDSDTAITALVSRLASDGLDPKNIALGDLLKDALAHGKISRG
jgi:Holliday junction DNA helicase RuvA